MMQNSRTLSRMALGLAIMLTAGVFATGQTAYNAKIRKWRAGQDKELKADDGWLTLAGLFWLKEGENRIGSDAASEVVLPASAAPARIGVMEYYDGKVTLRVAQDASVTLNKKPVTTAELQSDEKGKPDILHLGSLSFYTIKRGTRYGVRVKDLNSPARREFNGRHWYEINPAYRVTAKFIKSGQPREIEILNKVGDVIKMPSPGTVVFKLNGNEYSLDALGENGQLFFVFADQTSGKTTYGAGRFLYANAAKNGRVVLDFNKAVNPPCAFTPFATCPLPPRQNRLKVAIPAGELKYHEADEGEPAR